MNSRQFTVRAYQPDKKQQAWTQATTISDEAWDSRKAKLKSLYLDESKSAKEIRDLICEPDNAFNPTVPQLKARFAKWGFRKQAPRYPMVTAGDSKPSNASPAGSSSTNQDGSPTKPPEVPVLDRQESVGSSESTTPKSSDLYSAEARMRSLQIVEGVPYPEGIPMPHSDPPSDWPHHLHDKQVSWTPETTSKSVKFAPEEDEVDRVRDHSIDANQDDVIELPSGSISTSFPLLHEDETVPTADFSIPSPKLSQQTAQQPIVPKSYLIELLQPRLIGPKNTSRYDQQCLNAIIALLDLKPLSEDRPDLIAVDSILAADLLEIALTLTISQRNVGVIHQSALWLLHTEPSLREVLGAAISKATSVMHLSRLPELNTNPFQAFRMWRLFRFADLPKDKSKDKRLSRSTNPHEVRFFEKLKTAINDPKKDISRQLCDAALEEVKNNVRGRETILSADFGQLTIRHYAYMVAISADEYLSSKRSHKASTMVRWEFFRTLFNHDRDGFEQLYRSILPMLIKVFEDVLQNYDDLHGSISLETQNRFAKIFSRVWDYLSSSEQEPLAAFRIEAFRPFREAGFLDVEIWIAFIALVISLGSITEHETAGITLDQWCRKVLASVLTTDDTGYLWTIALYHTVSFEREGRPYFNELSNDIRKLFGHEKCPIPELAKFSTKRQAGAVWMNDAYLLSNPSIGSLGSIRNKVTRRGSQSSVSMLSAKSTSKSIKSMVSPSEGLRMSWSTFGSSNNILGQNIMALRSLAGSKRSSVRTPDDDGDITMND